MSLREGQRLVGRCYVGKPLPPGLGALGPVREDIAGEVDEKESRPNGGELVEEIQRGQPVGVLVLGQVPWHLAVTAEEGLGGVRRTPDAGKAERAGHRGGSNRLLFRPFALPDTVGVSCAAPACGTAISATPCAGETAPPLGWGGMPHQRPLVHER